MDTIGTFELAWDANCATGESPVWDAARGCLWFCDSPAGRVLGYEPATGRRRRHQVPDVVGSLALCRDGRLLLALRRRVALFDPATGALETLAEIDGIPDHARLNDGKIGPDGAFWVGGADLRVEKAPICALYRITPDARVEKKLDGLMASNGLAWSPDGTILYHSDSRGGWIDRWDFDPALGRMANRRRLATLSAEEGRPDGAACDSDGIYWSAGVSAGCLNGFSPDGALCARVALPAANPTMPCLADGAVFVTSLWGGLADESLAGNPLAGSLWRAPTRLRPAPIGTFDIQRRAS